MSYSCKPEIYSAFYMSKDCEAPEDMILRDVNRRKPYEKQPSPINYQTRKELNRFMIHWGCPASMTDDILQKFGHMIRQSSYTIKIDVLGTMRPVNIPCYYTYDVFKIFVIACRTAIQLKTKMGERSVFCYFPALEYQIKFDLWRFNWFLEGSVQDYYS